MKIGTTLSHRYLKYLGLDPLAALQDIQSLDIKIIRLCCYWDEIQPSPDRWDYSALQPLLEICQANNLQVVMTVGMKAPRWPEFYIPSWIQSKNLHEVAKYSLPYIEKTIQTLGAYSCITYWQVENEPLDPSGPDNLMIPADVLGAEIAQVKRLDSTRPIIVSIWGNDLTNRNLFPMAHNLANVIGIDIYYRQFIRRMMGVSLYNSPADSDKKLRQIIHASQQPVWITELQAEPWEHSLEEYKSAKPQSMNIDMLSENLDRARALMPEVTLLWGIEYWLWKKKQNDIASWNAFQDLIGRSQTSS